MPVNNPNVVVPYLNDLGAATFAGTIVAKGGGSAASPVVTFASSINSGFYYDGNNTYTVLVVTGEQAAQFGNPTVKFPGGSGAAPQYSPAIGARSPSSGNSLELGHSNAGGYACTLGEETTSGQPFIALFAGAGTTPNTYLTLGHVGRIITVNKTTNQLIFARATNSNANNQSLTTDAYFDASGNFVENNNATIAATLLVSTAAATVLSGNPIFTGSPTFNAAITIGAASGPTWTSGAGTPTATPTVGSLYSNTNGTPNACYVYTSMGWSAVTLANGG